MIKIHPYLSVFFSAAIILVAVSGVLYLIVSKGSVEQTPLGSLDVGRQLMADSEKEAVLSTLNLGGVTGFEFEYV